MNNLIIYGGGFTGLTATLAFAKFMDKITLIEPFTLAEKPRNGKDDRTTALSAQSKRFMESVGLWQEIADFAGEINDIKIVDNDLVNGDSLLKLDFASSDAGNDPMGYIVENNIFRQNIINKIRSLPNVEIIEGQKIVEVKNEPNCVNIKLEANNFRTLETQGTAKSSESARTLSSKLLLAVDGKNSFVKKYLMIRSIEKDYNQSAITFCIKHQKSHRQTAIERFTPTGPFAVLPLKEENYSSVVWTIPRHLAEIYMNMNQSRFTEEVKRRLGDDLGNFEFAGDKNCYPLKLRYSNKYYQHRVVFAGDSAHSIHPIAGQGFNQGVRDLSLLTKLVKENYQLGLDIGDDNILKKYERTRVADNMQMIAMTDVINSLFSNSSNIVRLARRFGIAGVDRMKPLKKFFVKRASGKI